MSVFSAHRARGFTIFVIWKREKPACHGREGGRLAGRPGFAIREGLRRALAATICTLFKDTHDRMKILEPLLAPRHHLGHDVQSSHTMRQDSLGTPPYP